MSSQGSSAAPRGARAADIETEARSEKRPAGVKTERRDRSPRGRQRTSPDALESLQADVADALVDWYNEVGRDLPWRRTKNPYEILVSEIMLQQTRVETVLGRYESFLARFPTIDRLAAADVEDVLIEWSGLGYYRRARGLHALAKVVVDEHSGEIPADLDALRTLPGLGPYSAAAVGSIAFGIPALSVDGNVGRALCRLAAIEGDPKRAPVRRQLEAMVAEAMQRHPPAALNQAIMELGARVCTSRAPRCDECPCASYCEAHAAGIEELIPPSSRDTVNAVTEFAAVIERDDRFLLFRGQRPSLVQDMWEFPTLDSRIASKGGRKPGVEPAQHDGPPASRAGLQRYLEDLGWRIELGPKLGVIRHGMTNRRIECRVYEGRAADGRVVEANVVEGRVLEADVVEGRVLEGRADAGYSIPDDAETSPKLVAEPGDKHGPTPESGWFTLEEATRLPLAASARKTLQELLGIDF